MKWGVALEGGGTRGAYHLGVFKALNEIGIDVGCVVGTSIGAINGAFFAQRSCETLYRLWDGIALGDIIALPGSAEECDNVFDIKNFGTVIGELHAKRGLDVTPLERLLKAEIDENKIRDSGIDFGLAAFSLTEKAGKCLFLEDIPRGRLVDYLLASACLPGFKVRSVGSELFLDGGISNKIPVNMLIDRGVSNIICVEVGGFGITKSVNAAGCNVITVRCEKPIVGLLDFDKNNIERTVVKGYFDACKAFGVFAGDRYTFTEGDFIRSRRKYSESLLKGVQEAAAFFGVDEYKIYTVDELCARVVSLFEAVPHKTDFKDILKWSDAEKAACLANAIIHSNADVLKNKFAAAALGGIFEAASAIAYLYSNMQNIQ